MGLISIVTWIAFGIVIGAIARFVMPGRQQMGIFMTGLLGVVGSFVGGRLSH